MAEIEPISEKKSTTEKAHAPTLAKTEAAPAKTEAAPAAEPRAKEKSAQDTPKTAAPQEERFTQSAGSATKSDINEGLKQAASKVTGEAIAQQKPSENQEADPATPSEADEKEPATPREADAGDEAKRKEAEERFKGSPGYDRLSDADRNELLDIYSKYPDKDPNTTEVLDSYKTLMKDGRLTGGTLDELNRIADPNYKLADGIDRNELLGQAVKDLANPQEIAQGGKSTCGATSAQIELAIRDPERYIETLGDLSSGSGPTAAQQQLAIRNPFRYLQTLGALSSQGGNASDIAPGLRRDSSTPIQDDGTGRSITTRIMSTSFMEYANGSWDYNDAKDSSLQGDESRKGLRTEEEAKLLEGVLGEKTNTVKESWKDNIPLIGDYKGRAMDEINDGLKDGRAVTVLVGWGDGGHYLNVQKVDDKYAYCVNPWGQMDRIPVDQLKDHLWTASITEGSAKAPPPSDILDWSQYRDMNIPDAPKK